MSPQTYMNEDLESKLVLLRQALEEVREEYIASHGVNDVLSAQRAKFREILREMQVGKDRRVDGIKDISIALRKWSPLMHPSSGVSMVDKMLRLIGENIEKQNPFKNTPWSELLAKEEFMEKVLNRFKHFTKMMIGNYRDARAGENGNHQVDAYEWADYKKFWSNHIEGKSKHFRKHEIEISELQKSIDICDNIREEIISTEGYKERLPNFQAASKAFERYESATNP